MQNKKISKPLTEKNLFKNQPTKTPSTTTSQISNNSKKMKVPHEIKKLLKNVTVETLLNFLKNKRAKHFLYNIPLKDGACLFTTLFYDKAKIETLFVCMRTPQYLDCFSEIPNKALCQAREEIPFAPSSSINNFALKGSIYSNYIEETSLQREFVNTTPLYWFAKTNAGNDILKNLLTINPNLANSITREALCRPGSSGLGKAIDNTPLTMLSRTTTGKLILKILRVNNPNLSELIFDPDFLPSLSSNEEIQSTTSSKIGMFSQSGLFSRESIEDGEYQFNGAQI
ncbi:MAG: hypothetical protein H0U73_06575 [Tatlockia sp.]|nr:hypothetical protein [Tatlockia sp.]